MATPIRAEVFSMESEPDQLALMRDWLRGELGRHELSPEDQAALLVAVGELCTNSIQHSYGGARGHPIRVSLQTFSDHLVIEVEDFGQPFDAARYRAPNLDAVPERGLGLYLVRQIADRLSIDVNRDRGTRWTIVKYRQTPGSDAEARRERRP